MKRYLLLLIINLCFFVLWGQDVKKIYTFTIDENITNASLRKVEMALEGVKEQNADVLLLHLNTFGGELEAADQIRTLLLRCEIPVWVYIDNNAASAGALISIACDSIYMNEGASIGAASVVDQQGNVLPDKYQSYMRSLMRTTAETNGRNPDIAQAMVDPDIHIDGIIDSGKVLTFTTSEAMKYQFCEGECHSIEEVIAAAHISNYTLIEQKLTWIERVILFLMNPVISSLLIMAIIGGIYFEMQAPGIGFPLIIAILAALLYFAPHYLGGLAEYWEIALFFVGLVLLILELFLFPGFGICGITGIILMCASLVLVMIFNVGFDFSFTAPITILEKFLIVVISLVVGSLISIWLGKKLITAETRFGTLALRTELSKDDGYVSQDLDNNQYVNKIGVAITPLRPSGKVEVDGEIFDAISQSGFIDKGVSIRIIRFDTSQLVVTKM